MKKLANVVCTDCGSTNLKETRAIDKVTEKIDNGFGYFTDSPWCYLVSFTGTENFEDCAASDVLEAISDYSCSPCIQFSVTNEEPMFQDYLDAVSGIPGHTIFEYDRGTHTVFLCTFPTRPVL